MATHEMITLNLNRRILEHPDALHIRRMRAAIWLYLEILSRLPDGKDSVRIEPAAIGSAMGLPEGTIRSWLGHLRKARYVELDGQGAEIGVRVKHHMGRVSETNVPAPRFFTIQKIAEALGEQEGFKAVGEALDTHSDEAVRKALAGALAVPAKDIRRSRTALFLYLLRQNTHET